MSEKQIIEINGIKMEVDFRNAKIIENYKVGDNVKVLIKTYSGFDSYPGVIIGFDQFEKLPTIIICYVEMNYSKAEVKFTCLNELTKDIQIVHMQEHELKIDRQKAIDYLDRCIFKASEELLELHRKKDYFVEKFNLYLME